MMRRFLLQRSTQQENWWVLTDTRKGIVIKFEQGKFNKTQQITYLEDIELNPTAIAHDLRIMADWLAQYYYHLAVENPQPSFDREYHRKMIGVRLRELRNANRMTIDDVAEATGIHRTNISKIENGKYGFTIDVVNQLANLYGYKVIFEKR